MMNHRMRYIQLALEASIPLLGFFLWNWSLYFILLFYFLDMISNEIIMHLKSQKISTYNNTIAVRKSWFKHAAYSLLVLIAGISLIHSAMLFIQPSILFWKEIVGFWKYEEMGIQQGYLFVPLVFLMSYQQYKMEFLIPARFRSLSIQTIWIKHTRALIFIVAFALISLLLALFIALPEIIFVIGIVLLVSVYRLKFGF